MNRARRRCCVWSVCPVGCLLSIAAAAAECEGVWMKIGTESKAVVLCPGKQWIAPSLLGLLSISPSG